MKWTRFFFLLPILAVALLTGCQTAGDRRVAQLFGGQPETIANAPCKLYRVDPVPSGDEGPDIVYGHEILDGPVTPSPELDRKLRHLLLDPDTYAWQAVPVVKLCNFEPVVLLRFGNMDVLVSLACGRLRTHRNGRVLERQDFDPAYNEVLALLKAAFPDDFYLQLFKPVSRPFHSK